MVSDRYSTYKVPAKSFFADAWHIRVQSFKDDISNNLVECFNKQFKAWYKTKQGFSPFESANNLISMFVFFFNFVCPHSAQNGLTPAQVQVSIYQNGENVSSCSSREAFLWFWEFFFHFNFTLPIKNHSFNPCTFQPAWNNMYNIHHGFPSVLYESRFLQACHQT